MNDWTPTQHTIVAQALQKAAEAAGMINPLDSSLVMDRVRISDDGFVYGETKALEELRKDRPHLFRPAAPAKHGPKVVEKPGAGPKTSASDMTPAETIAANKGSRVWREALSGDGRI